MTAELLVSTRKGLFVLRGDEGARGPMAVAARAFPGEEVEYAIRDPRSGRYLASMTHWHHGPHVFWADDPAGPWHEADGPRFPEETGATAKRIWTIHPGEDEGVLYCGVDPAALFRSEDSGESWRLVRGLWDVEGRERWQPGGGGLCLHSIVPWPGEPDRLAVGISAAGVWVTEDRGETWAKRVEGITVRYVPDEAQDADAEIGHCIHNLHRAPARPERLWMQFHGGVYRSDDEGRKWIEVGAGLPSDFGFPLVCDPRDPDRAFVIPLVADLDRVTPEGMVRVYETRDAGGSWTARAKGLPSEDAYLTVLRQAFCQDGGDPLGLYFGATSGAVFGSADGGASWRAVAGHLPPVLAVRAG